VRDRRARRIGRRVKHQTPASRYIPVIRAISGLSTSTLQRINDLTLRSHFPRKGSKNFTQYFSERPEMTSHGGKPKKAKQQNLNRKKQ
jgi:hypothetical protein